MGARTAGLLGYAGLLPFLGLAIAAATGTGPENAAAWFAGYSAVILSFLGGIRWGLASATDGGPTARDLVLAVALSLWGWFSLLLPVVQAQVAVLLAGHGAALAADRLLPAARQPAWLSQLRLVLSAGALICHAVVLLGL